MNFYRTRNLNQYRVMEFLKQRFYLDICIIWPISPDGLLLEDQAGKQIAFTCTENGVIECEVPPAGGKSDVRRFAQLVQQKLPEPQKQTFNAKSDLWHNTKTNITYQQALGLDDTLFRHYLTHEPLSLRQIIFRITGGFVSDEDYRSIQLWYLNGHTLDAHLIPGGVDSQGKYVDFALHPLPPSTSTYRFYLAESNAH